MLLDFMAFEVDFISYFRYFLNQKGQQLVYKTATSNWFVIFETRYSQMFAWNCKKFIYVELWDFSLIYWICFTKNFISRDQLAKS